MKRHLRLLHLEDNPVDAESIRSALVAEGFDFEHIVVKNKSEFEAALLQGGIDLVLSDFSQADYDANSALACVRSSFPELPFVMVSESVGEEVAVETLLNGATDYVPTTRLERLGQAIRRALTQAEASGLQRQAQERLRQNESMFRRIIENVDDLIAVLDLTGKRVFNSPSYSALLGNADLLAGTDSFEEIHPDDRDHMRRIFRETALTGRGRRIEYRIVLHDGSIRTIESQGSAIRDSNGDIAQILVVSRDITSRKEAEEKIRDQAALLDKAQDAICVMDLSQQVLYWNKAAERLYGWRADEAVGRNANDLMFQGNHEPALKALRELIRRGEWIGELQHTDRAGHGLIVESRWTLMRDEHGQPKSILVINTDVTEKRQTEAKFLRNQRMESIGALAGGIAHDLNNALAPILMAADLLASELTTDSSRRLLDTMRSSAQRGSEMVKQILSFARGVSGEHRRLQLSHLLFDLEAFIRSTFPPGIQVQRKVSRDLRPVLGDPTQLHQVLLNLCVNARDAMPEGGKLVMEARNIEVDKSFPRRESEGPHIVLTVSDTGHGIPANIIEKIFEPFFTTKEVGKGTGLGLSTVLGIVKTHGGFMEVSSQVGSGAAFRVFLPADTSALHVAEPSHAVLPGGRGEVILVVDDDHAVLEITKLSLEANDYRILTASDGREALSLYEQRHAEIKLVMTDMLMPSMNGAELARRMRMINPAVKIIGISAQGPESEVPDASESPFQAFLSKPFTTEALLFHLHEALDQ